MPSAQRSKSYVARSKRGARAVTRLLPYIFSCTIGPSVTAATALYVVRSLMCLYDAERHGTDPLPGPDDGWCAKSRVGALTASVMAALATVDGIVSFLSTSTVQKWADKLGRRPLMILLPLLASVSSLAMVVAFTARNTTLTWVCFALTGIFVSASTKSVFVPTLCVADIASDDQRTRFYSRLEAVSLLGPGTAYIMSALSSRYIPIVLFPYYSALASNVLASAYAAAAVPETLNHTGSGAGRGGGGSEDEQDSDEEESDAGQEGADNEGEDQGWAETIENIVDPLVEPIKPLKLLLPRKENGVWHWRLFIVTLSMLATSCGTVFIVTASLLFLSDKFSFDPEHNAWVLAYLAFAKGAYLVLIFPWIQKGGRNLFNRIEARRAAKRTKGAAGGATERTPLVRRKTGDRAVDEANQFDTILVFLSVTINALSLILVSLAQTSQAALIAFSVFALGSGDAPTYKSVFVAAVPDQHASQALAALDMVFNGARLLSPLLLGGLYAWFAERGRPELLFTVAGGLCALGAALIAPLVFLRTPTLTAK